jgi:hypothetical protein
MPAAVVRRGAVREQAAAGKPVVGVRLSREARDLLRELASLLGVSQAAVLEIAPRRFVGGKLWERGSIREERITGERLGQRTGAPRVGAGNLPKALRE